MDEERAKEFIEWSIRSYCRVWVPLLSSPRRNGLNAALNAFSRPDSMSADRVRGTTGFLLGISRAFDGIFRRRLDDSTRSRRQALLDSAFQSAGFKRYYDVANALGLGGSGATRSVPRFVRIFVASLLKRVIDDRITLGHDDASILTAIENVGAPLRVELEAFLQ